MVDQLTAAIKAKDAHKVSQYVSLLIVSGHHLSGPTLSRRSSSNRIQILETPLAKHR
jgi:hypothetical protein